jgi:hypothetical protein
MLGTLVITSEIIVLSEGVWNAKVVFPIPVMPKRRSAEALAAHISIVIADSERAAALGRKAQRRALSTAGYAPMLAEHAGVFRRTEP